MAEKSLKNLLNPNADKGLGELVQRAQEMDSLASQLQAALGAEFENAITAANIKADGELVVLASSSAWAARLRFETDSILAAAREAGHDAPSCRVRVNRG
ncbi:MAG: DUF721 domain-containing protein [Pseudomonadota bacterium]